MRTSLPTTLFCAAVLLSACAAEPQASRGPREGGDMSCMNARSKPAAAAASANAADTNASAHAGHGSATASAGNQPAAAASGPAMRCGMMKGA